MGDAVNNAINEAVLNLPIHSARVENIPVQWVEPNSKLYGPRRLIIFLPHFSGTKESVTRFLTDLAGAGFVALSFDPWKHGERGSESHEEIFERVFAAFRRRMWPILGQTTLDTLRVIDWAIETLKVEPVDIRVGGLSMGGDVAVAAAALDHRIQRIGAVVATPDWLRPGMHDAFDSSVLVEQGLPDSYALFFFDQFNPMTHLESYSHAPQIRFFCGDQDNHVPVDAALRFQDALLLAHPEVGHRISVELIAGLAHMDVRDADRWWSECFRWLIDTEIN